MSIVKIVILNWNGVAHLRRFLPSVVAAAPAGVEVVVADNGSTDDSVEVLRSEFPSVTVLRMDRNYGFAGGYNRALQRIEADYYVLLNSDVETPRGWLAPLVEALDRNPDVGVVSPKLISSEDRRIFEYAGASGGFMDKYGYPFCRGRLLHIVEEDSGQYDTPIDVLWATGACLFIRTDVYKAVGGLDGDFFAHQEEIDMCWRLRARGYRLVCTPQSVIYHKGGGTLNVESPRKTFLNFRNNLLMLYKNLPDKDLKPVMRLRFWLDYLAALKFFLTGHVANAKAVYQARREFYQLLPQFEHKRMENMRKMVLAEIPELKSYSLLWQFYLKGRKHYSELPQ